GAGQPVREVADQPGQLFREHALGQADCLAEPQPETDPLPLASFLRQSVESRPDVKAATKGVWQQCIRNLVEFFRPEQPIPSITAGDAERFKAHLLASGLAQTTVHKRLNFCRQFFNSAVKSGRIDLNPFAEVRAARGSPKDRQWYVSIETTERLIDAAPNTDWRTIIALCRFGGLRCPSEVLSLKWEHVDWQRRLLRVPQPKLEPRAGKAFRDVPLFGALRRFFGESLGGRRARSDARGRR
ncbi:MAG: hypothetical protein GXP27_19225, partial [Planctomycetes bacterium]|nr:hypothetical protein [Planctomycetota bacterium]